MTRPSAGLQKKSCCSWTTGRKGKVVTLFCWFFLLLICPPLYGGETPIPGLNQYISQGAYAIQLNGNIVRSKHLEKKFIPASTIKVLTALMALDILGPDYTFATRVYQDDTGKIYIKGEGDPLLTSEAITTIADNLKQLGLRKIDRIILDDTAFALEGPPDGSENTHHPYDAHSSALAVNFNALPFTVVNKSTISPLEKQTPLLPIMTDIAKNLGKGNYRVNVSAYPQQKPHSNIMRYSGELFTAIFKQEGITMAHGYEIGSVPVTARLIYLHESQKNVAEMVQSCLHYSSNFIANQLFLSCGRRIFGFPATWEKSKRMAQRYLALRLNIQRGEIELNDGSGLSTNNRISAETMLKILNRFTPYVSLMKKSRGVFLKSGTLTGAYSYVGYFEKEDQLIPFVLFLNQKRNTRKKVLLRMKNEVDSLPIAS